jgi:hypothetical protein
MTHFVGLDASERTTSICVMDGNGTVVKEGTVETDPAVIVAYFARPTAPLPPHRFGIHRRIRASRTRRRGRRPVRRKHCGLKHRAPPVGGRLPSLSTPRARRP